MATAALILVTAVWGITFVQVKDAVALYPVVAFLAVRYVIASAALAPLALTRLKSLGRDGLVAGGVLGALIALGIGLQTAGLARTTVTSTGLPPSGLAASTIPFDSMPISFAGFRFATITTVRPTSASG